MSDEPPTIGALDLCTGQKQHDGVKCQSVKPRSNSRDPASSDASDMREDCCPRTQSRPEVSNSYSGWEQTWPPPSLGESKDKPLESQEARTEKPFESKAYSRNMFPNQASISGRSAVAAFIAVLSQLASRHVTSRSSRQRLSLDAHTSLYCCPGRGDGEEGGGMRKEGQGPYQDQTRTRQGPDQDQTTT